ncbi:MAG: hypothetical protein R3C39_08465 [Dehalococcoidia bacterium]
MTGRQLREWMLRHGYTVQSLGVALGVAERTVYRWRSSSGIPKYVELALEALERRERDHRATRRGA